MDWPIDWLTDWLIGWLIDWLIDWLLVPLIDWLCDRLVGELVDWINNLFPLTTTVPFPSNSLSHNVWSYRYWFHIQDFQELIRRISRMFRHSYLKERNLRYLELPKNHHRKHNLNFLGFIWVFRSKCENSGPRVSLQFSLALKSQNWRPFVFLSES